MGQSIAFLFPNWFTYNKVRMIGNRNRYIQQCDDYRISETAITIICIPRLSVHIYHMYITDFPYDMYCNLVMVSLERGLYADKPQGNLVNHNRNSLIQ